MAVCLAVSHETCLCLESRKCCSQEHQRVFLMLHQQQYEKIELSDSRTEGGRKLTGIQTESEQELQVGLRSVS